MTRKTRWMLIEAVVVLAILIALLVDRFPQFLEAQNINTPENFPDPMFRLCAESFMGVQPGEHFTRSEAERQTGYLSVHYRFTPGFASPIQSLQGIQFFKSVERMDLYSVFTDSIDLSDLEELSYLQIFDCQFKELDLSQNSNLSELDITESPLTSLDLRQNKKLTKIQLEHIKLTELYLPSSASLQELDCHHTQLTSLDISQSPSLWRLDLADNLFENPIDISHNPKLKALVLENNRYDCLDLPALQELAKRFLEDTYYINHLLTRGFLYLKQGGLDLSNCGK